MLTATLGGRDVEMRSILWDAICGGDRLRGYN
jgi:hypothetical protein